MIADLIKRCLKGPAGKVDLLPDGGTAAAPPLDPDSPWPKFRADAAQTGRSVVTARASNLKPFEYRTGKGIFSSPVIDGDGTIYIGSADHYFYALSQTGELKWRFATKEIIDSSALLDDKGRVYFGSGDGHVYCLERASGVEVWRFKAHTTAEVKERFGIKTYNLNWFEGNLAMLGDGTILAPNDNYLVYALDRDTGRMVGHFPANEMVWSCPAVNAATGRIFFGSGYIAAVNFFCYDSQSGRKLWTSGGLGSSTASPLLTSAKAEGAAIYGGYDGILRAVSQNNGRQIWSFGSQDHLYASPAQLSDGTIILASCSGTVFGLDPASGRPKWTFDTLAPIRSSPAVDGRDRIYFGSGEGRLYCLNKDGSFRWAWQCIDGIRNDLNGSPGLGKEGVCIAGENGGIFFVPYDYPLSPAGQEDERSIIDPAQVALKNGRLLFYTEPFGRLSAQPPEKIQANEPITLTHILRHNDATPVSAIEAKSLKVNFPAGQRAKVRLSANRKFICLIPEEIWTGPQGGPLVVEVGYKIKTKLRRFGLKFFGGRTSQEHREKLTFQVAPYGSEKGDALPYAIPGRAGERGSVLEISRLSCPNPSILPSYNQIGFDSLHYLAAVVAGQGNRAALWVIPGKLDEASGRTLVEPGLKDIFVLNLDFNGGLLTLSNYEKFKISFVGSWDMPMGLYRIAALADAADGRVLSNGALSAEALCDDIRFYGKFLKIMGLSDFKTGRMQVSGGLDLGLWTAEDPNPLAAAGQVSLEIKPDRALARFQGADLKKDDHVCGILLLNPKTGQAINLDYARRMEVQADADGLVSGIELSYPRAGLSGPVEGLVMVDTLAVLRQKANL